MKLNQCMSPCKPMHTHCQTGIFKCRGQHSAVGCVKYQWFEELWNWTEDNVSTFGPFWSHNASNLSLSVIFCSFEETLLNLGAIWTKLYSCSAFAVVHLSCVYCLWYLMQQSFFSLTLLQMWMIAGVAVCVQVTPDINNILVTT